jgi:SAM-dependent methyltransferase
VSPRYETRRRADVRELVPWSPFAYVAWRLRQCITRLVEGAALAPDATVVDYGCADAPYRGLFGRKVTYVGADLEGNPRADVELRADGTLPLDEGSVDLVLSTQVLEHVEDPALYLSECARVLRPGGSLVLSTHGIMYLHRDPDDFWRWTCDGLEKVVADAGLDVAEADGVLGLVPAGLMLVQVGIARRLPRFALKPVIVVFQALIAATDLGSSATSRREFGLVIAVRATKGSP